MAKRSHKGAKAPKKLTRKKPPTSRAAKPAAAKRVKKAAAVKLERWKLERLKPHPENPRSHDKKNLAAIEASIVRCGYITPIVVNKQSGYIVAGHGRWIVAKRLVANGKSEFAELDVLVCSLDAATERAYLFADNRTAEMAGWDDTLLAALCLQASADGDAELMQSLAVSELLHDQADVAEDEVPAPPKKPVTKPGDLWLLGEHRLLCGDSTKKEDVGRVMADAKAVLMNTDPPYGVDYAAVKNGIPRTGFRDIQERCGDIENDDLTSGPELQAFLEKAIRAAVPHLVKNPAFYFWHPMLTQGTFFAAAAAAAADILIHRQIIWVKPHLVLTRSGMYHWQHELCFYGWIRGKPCAWLGDKSQTSVWHCGESQRDRVHHTQKPIELFARPLKNHTKLGELCYEPFAGSGSQFSAAEQLGRRCFGLEISPAYCDVVVERWQNLTGQKASRQAARKPAKSPANRKAKRTTAA